MTRSNRTVLLGSLLVVLLGLAGVLHLSLPVIVPLLLLSATTLFVMGYQIGTERESR